MPLFTQEKHRKPARTALREPPDPAPAAPAGAAGDADPTPRPARGAVLWQAGAAAAGVLLGAGQIFGGAAPFGLGLVQIGRASCRERV